MDYADAGYVYAITNVANGKRYIGSTINPKKRWVTHKSTLRKGKHHSFVLQRAWDKYGENSFSFTILLVCPAQKRVDYEEKIMPTASYNLFRTNLHKPVIGAKISRALLGKPKTEAHKRAISEGKTGVTMDTAFCEKARARQLGVSPSVATRNKLSKAAAQFRQGEKEKHRKDVISIYNTYKLGDNVAELCKAKGLTTSTFYSHCVSMGLPSVKEKAVGVAVETVKKAIARGYSFVSACKDLGIAPKNMRAIMARRQVK